MQPFNYHDLEDAVLAAYAVKSADSRGRAHPEPEHPYRSPFQRDRDRVIHSSAFRRLEAKTQVFTFSEGDYYRNRLTHTIEVSQISRTIARALRLNEELAEAIALAHDLGHSPFGHVGESVLHELMRDQGGFEHNRQGLRVVDILETRYPDFPGLNLTWEVREGIIKHRTTYDAPDIPGAPDAAESPSMEAQVVNVADEITYSCHDTDDALKAGIITEKDLADVDLPAEALQGMDHPELAKSEKMRRYQIVRRLIDLQVTDLIACTRRNMEVGNIHTLADVKKAGDVIVSVSADMAGKAKRFKKFLYDNFYRHPRVVESSSIAKRIISGLFNAYREDFGMIPQDIRKRGDQDPEIRTVCDYVAGMTDRFAINEYRRLHGEL